MYEQLLIEAEQLGIDTYEKPLPKKISGLYADNVIYINSNIQSTSERSCVLAEEMGHYHTTHGDILDQSTVMNRKYEHAARRWAYEKLVSLESIVKASQLGIRNRYELAQHLDVTEEFLDKALTRYKDKYGVVANYHNYLIYFEPLAVLETFE